MNWSQAKEEFRNVLNIERSRASTRKASARNLPFKSNRLNLFLDRQPSPENTIYKLRLDQIEKAEKFLSSLEEIKDFCPKIDENFLADFLEAAKLAFSRPELIDNHKKLSKFQQNLQKRIGSVDDGYIRSARSNRASQFKLQIAARASALFLLLLLIAAPAPVIGLLIVAGVGLAISLFVAAFSGYKVYKNDQFISGELYRDISSFVEDFNHQQQPEAEVEIFSPVFNQFN